MFDMYGHPTGIRSTALLSDDELASTVSMNNTRIWNVGNRACVHSTSPSPPAKSKKGVSAGCYWLCTINFAWKQLTCTHVVLNTRKGHLLVVDIALGDVVYTEENAYDGVIWSLDLCWLRLPTAQNDCNRHWFCTLISHSRFSRMKYRIKRKWAS
jgi:U3 small nucleolar RNA-associated protein 12